MFTNCNNNTGTYMFHFATAFHCTGSVSSEEAIQEIQSNFNFSKTFEYTMTRDEAIAAAQTEFDNAISKITKDYTDYFTGSNYVTISMEMFYPDDYVVDSKTWGNIE